MVPPVDTASGFTVAKWNTNEPAFSAEIHRYTLVGSIASDVIITIYLFLWSVTDGLARRKSVSGQHCFGITAVEIGEKRGGFLVFSARNGQRHGVDHLGVEFLGNRKEYFGILGLQCVGAVDEGAIDFTPLGKHQALPNVLSHYQLLLQLLSQARFLEGFHRVLASRHTLGTPDRDSVQLQQILHRGRLAGSAGKDQGVMGEGADASISDQFLVPQVVHPLLVGGNEQVGRGTAFYLLGKLARGAIVLEKLYPRMGLAAGWW